MKLIILALIISPLFLISCAQNIPASKVPSVVLNKVQIEFPGVNDIEWEKKANFYEAEFNVDTVEHNLQIDASGNLLQHSREIPIASLPIAINNAVNSAYAGYNIDDADIINKNGQMIYELELEAKGKKDLKVLYSANAELITNN
jgi:hypothetical protein